MESEKVMLNSKNYIYIGSIMLADCGSELHHKYHIKQYYLSDSIDGHGWELDHLITHKIKWYDRDLLSYGIRM